MTSALTAPDAPRRAPREPHLTATAQTATRPPETSPRDAAATLILITRGAHEPHVYANLIERHQSAYDVLLDERLKAAPQTSFFEDPEAALNEELSTIERQIREWRFQGTQLLTVLDARYPANLRAQAQRPPLLFVAGRLKPRDDTAVAIIGCPEAARTEIRCAEAIAQGLAAQKRTVISGLSAGVDTAAHLAALKRGGRTIAVIGTGVSLCYPRANVILQRRIAAECAVVSPFMPDAGPTAATFAQRIPVMSGMATATIVVAANPVGTIRAHAQQAAATGRPLILLEGVLRHKWARELAESPTVTVALTSGEAVDAAA
jgi:DNA processing protein